MKRYILVGGNPFSCYTGTLTFTGLGVVGSFDSKEEADVAFTSAYDSAGGLLLIIDTEESNPSDSK